jgi:hypothetical protein
MCSRDQPRSHENVQARVEQRPGHRRRGAVETECGTLAPAAPIWTGVGVAGWRRCSLATVKFGLYGLHKGENTEPEAFARRARAAEEAGFESLWVGDHIALPPDAPDDAYDPRLEAIVALAHLAAVTERVRLGLG